MPLNGKGLLHARHWARCLTFSPHPLHGGLIPSLAGRPPRSLAPSTRAPCLPVVIMLACKAASGWPVKALFGGSGAQATHSSLAPLHTEHTGPEPLTALQPFSTASAPSVPSAVSPSVPSSGRGDMLSPEAPWSRGQEVGGRGSSQCPGSPLSESLLSEQSVREALLSGSSGLPPCFLFFFLV